MIRKHSEQSTNKKMIRTQKVSWYVPKRYYRTSSADRASLHIRIQTMCFTPLFERDPGTIEWYEAEDGKSTELAQGVIQAISLTLCLKLLRLQQLGVSPIWSIVTF